MATSDVQPGLDKVFNSQARFFRAADAVWDGVAGLAGKVSANPRGTFRLVWLIAALAIFCGAMLGGVLPAIDRAVYAFDADHRHAEALEHWKKLHPSDEGRKVTVAPPSLETAAIYYLMSTCMRQARQADLSADEYRCSAQLISQTALQQGEARATEVRDLLVKNNFHVPDLLTAIHAADTTRSCFLDGVKITGSARIECLEGKGAIPVARAAGN